MRFFFFALESDEDVSEKSDDEGSRSGFTSSSCVSSCFEISVDRVSLLSSNQVTISVGSVRGIFSELQVSCSKTSLVSSSEFLK